MKSSNKNFRTLYTLKSAIKQYFSMYKSTFIIGCIVFIIGVIMGVVIVSYYSDSIEIVNIIDKNIYLLLTRQRGVFTIFFLYSLLNAVYISIIIFVNVKPWNIVFSLIVLFVVGYIYSYNVAILITLFGFTGLINCLIFIIPFDIVLGFLLIIMFSIAFKRNLITNKFGCEYFEKNCFINYKNFIIWMIIIFYIVLLLKCLVMPALRISIIIN